MRDIAGNILTAMRARTVATRGFVWFIPKNRNTGALEPIGFWEGPGAITATVADPIDGAQTRVFNGSAIQGIPDIPLTSDIAVHRVTLKLAAFDESTSQLLRTSEAKGAPCRVFVGFFQPSTQRIINNALPRFVGFINRATFTNGRQGEVSSCALELVSHTQELRILPDFRRSLTDQQKRSASDTFHRDAEAMAEREVAWGKNTMRGDRISDRPR